jgi:hypothetical protein
MHIHRLSHPCMQLLQNCIPYLNTHSYMFQPEKSSSGYNIMYSNETAVGCFKLLILSSILLSFVIGL